MLQVILNFDQNLISFLLQNWSKFDQKSIKKWHRIQSWFWNRYFFNFWTIFEKLWNQNGWHIREESGFGSVPDSQVDPKGRLDPTWGRSGTILVAFWNNFGSKNARVFDENPPLDAFPTLKWTPKVVWTALGAALGAFWKDLLHIFCPIWIKFWYNLQSKTCTYKSISISPLYLSRWPAFVSTHFVSGVDRIG